MSTPQELYNLASELRQNGYTDIELKQILLHRGMDEMGANDILGQLTKSFGPNQNAPAPQQAPQNAPTNSGETPQIPRWLIWVGALILVNVMSAAFNWGFWLY